MAKLLKKIVYTGKITLKTGLHIGGTNTALNIGGPDSFVVRNPLTNIPYIPGSSLKGKMRSLIELRDGTITANGDVTNNVNTNSGSLFGTSGDNNSSHPSRVIVRDAELDLSDPHKFDNTDLPFTESKTEVTINRITAKANPRTIERVPAGAVFNMTMVLNIFDSDNEQQLKNTLQDAMALLEDDYLGGNGSRGYGQIQFSNVNTEEKDY